MTDLEYVIYLLDAALDTDRKRRWWQRPNRRWVARVEQARNMVQRLSERVYAA